MNEAFGSAYRGSNPCAGTAQNEQVRATRTENVPGRASYARRFWAKVDRSAGPKACWPWTAAMRGTGYGCMNVGGKLVDSHRLAYELAHGAIPLPGLCVTHACDNRACCNPAHLSVGTKKDNHDDMKARHRAPSPDGISAKKREIRDTVGVAGQKLTRETAEAIRREHAAGANQIELARRYGVGRSTIGRVVRGERWLDERRAG